MKIPLVDLHAQYSALKQDIDAAIQRTIDRTAFIGGDDVRAFESEFAAYCEAEAAVGVGNGTDALYLALRALGIGRDDEVITVAHTFIATAEAISLTGARPVFVDIDEQTMLMDVDAAERAITARTRAIVPVHLYGQTCDMDRIMALADRFGLKVVEDAAQAHGARWRGRRAGTIGHAGCFSFFPGKNLGAYGDAGGVVSRDGDLITRVRMLANHGRVDKYVHQIEGVNSRLDGIQAAVLRVKLRQLEASNERRRQHADRYGRMLAESGAQLPAVRSEAEPVWHLYVIRVADRDEIWKQMNDRGVAAGVHYPVPLHRQPAYEALGIEPGALPVTERAAAHVLSLPLYPELADPQIDEVCRTLLDVMCVQPSVR